MTRIIRTWRRLRGRRYGPGWLRFCLLASLASGNSILAAVQSGIQRDLWSVQPLQRPDIPTMAGAAASTANPIAQEDYYSLQAVFAAVDRADKPYDTLPEVARERRDLNRLQAGLESRRKALHDSILARAGEPLADLDRKITAQPMSPKKGDAFGYHSGIEKQPDIEKWVQVDLGRSVPLGSIVLHPCRDDFNNIGDGFGFPARFKIELAEDESFKDGVVAIGDSTLKDVPNPGLEPRSVDAGGHPARFVRVTATRLALRQDDYNFALPN